MGDKHILPTCDEPRRRSARSITGYERSGGTGEAGGRLPLEKSAGRVIERAKDAFTNAPLTPSVPCRATFAHPSRERYTL
jgi:hypothetical protein